MGRPSKLTPEVQQRICDAIAAGNYRETAAQYAGIAAGTFYVWMAKGEQAHSGQYHEFREAVKKAEANAETRNVAIIETAAQTSWQAAAWWLERKHRDRWARQERVEHSGTVGVTLADIAKAAADDHGD